MRRLVKNSALCKRCGTVATSTTPSESSLCACGAVLVSGGTISPFQGGPGDPTEREDVSEWEETQ